MLTKADVLWCANSQHHRSTNPHFNCITFWVACIHASRPTQVLGDRDLMEHEVVGQLAKRNSATPDYLHVFVKLADVASVSLDREDSRPLVFDLSDAPTKMSPRSALTHSLGTSKPVTPVQSKENRYAAQLTA